MGSNNLNRFDRIVAILIQLQSRRIVKAQELADRFKVSLRTIYRDVRTLERSGIPIVSEAGVGYSIMEGYRLPPIMFSREEASSFVAAEKLMQQFTDKTLGGYHESAMFKIKSVLRTNEKDWVSSLESHIHINTVQDVFNNIPDALEILFESIAEKKQVFLKYRSVQSDSSTERMVEPVGLFHQNNFWYIMGYCHLRKDYRQFRTDRMLKIRRTDLGNTLVHGPLDDYYPKQDDCVKTKVRILVDKRVAPLLQSNRKYYGFVSEKIKKNRVEMTFMARDLEQGFARWYLMFGDYARILEPERLKERVREILTRTEAALD
jgi:predicted DNA-binding transcriptional regulator YafY